MTGLNLTVDTLAKKIQSTDLPFDAYVLLVDNDNYLLVSSDANQSFRDFNKQSFFALHTLGKTVNDALGKHIMLTFTQNDAMIVKRTAIPGTNLSIVICASKANVLSNVNRVFERSKTVGYWALGLIALFYAIFFIFRFVDIRQLADSLAQKLQQVIDFSNQLGMSDNAMPTNSTITEFTLLQQNLNAVHTKLQHLLIEDSLTQLPNRRKLLNDLHECNVKALLLCDINQFQYINDVYGTQAGDIVLRTIAKRLEASKEGFDACYRLEPDVFAITFLNSALDETTLKAFIQALQLPVAFESEQIAFGMTSGLAVNEPKEKLYSCALIALAEAKQNNRGGIVTYSAELAMNQAYEKNLLWSHKSRLALQESRILPYFQPILNLKSGRIDKFEALIRMREGDKIIAPFFFLEPAKRTGILKELTKSMIAQVFAEAVKFPDIEFSINVSFTDLLDESLYSFIESQCNLTSLQTKRIIFEVLETEALPNEEKIVESLQRLKRLGFQIAIDDFGAGYSNFAHLLKMQVNLIKIDGQFIKGLPDDANSYTIAKTVSEFSQLIQTKCVAEFVENEAVLAAVKALNIDYAQGYAISKPIPAQEIAQWAYKAI